ncbi:PTS fructose transporter subunit IIB [Enterococcus sp. BWB1-3]|uniref:PTS fructose transporter subunit IIB n=1 Tax=unclassified Enterococcus TaxID=2608891 RepID=UPI0019238337|nr:MULTISPECIES: PTS fructose transporter subunit IIB [unclassified Enterococcus]MBL1230024.1 PTS fructose transporter subunit IIB [Enterococcus sp. BWB1-3]MCB5952414.1 fructose PTS transporter subunit IIB [Enterococcus sp. BWT-B8]
MKIVGITACTAGIAHTYIAKEKLEKAAIRAGDDVKIETQGSIGVENELSSEEIKQADVVVIATDISVSRDRFKGKKVIEIPISLVMKSPEGVIKKIHEKLVKG